MNSMSNGNDNNNNNNRAPVTSEELVERVLAYGDALLAVIGDISEFPQNVSEKVRTDYQNLRDVDLWMHQNLRSDAYKEMARGVQLPNESRVAQATNEPQVTQAANEPQVAQAANEPRVKQALHPHNYRSVNSPTEPKQVAMEAAPAMLSDDILKKVVKQTVNCMEEKLRELVVDEISTMNQNTRTLLLGEGDLTSLWESLNEKLEELQKSMKTLESAYIGLQAFQAQQKPETNSNVLEDNSMRRERSSQVDASVARTTVASAMAPRRNEDMPRREVPSTPSPQPRSSSKQLTAQAERIVEDYKGRYRSAKLALTTEEQQKRSIHTYPFVSMEEAKKVHLVENDGKYFFEKDETRDNFIYVVPMTRSTLSPDQVNENAFDQFFEIEGLHMGLQGTVYRLDAPAIFEKVGNGEYEIRERGYITLQ